MTVPNLDDMHTTPDEYITIGATRMEQTEGRGNDVYLALSAREIIQKLLTLMFNTDDFNNTNIADV